MRPIKCGFRSLKAIVTQLAREVLDFAPFRRSYVREFELSHSKLVNRIIKITHPHNLHNEAVGLSPFYNS